MKVLGIILLVLLALSLLPLGVRVRYDKDALSVFARLWFIPIQVLPAKAKKDKGKKKEKKPKKPKKEPEEEAPPAKKGGKLDAVRSALPLVKPALLGVKKRLTIRELELFVTWAANDPADAAVGYGYAQAALGTLWAVVDQNFKVKKSRLGCSVDFDAPDPTVYADATLTMRLGQIVTLVIPLLIRFLSNASRIKRARTEKSNERGETV